MHIAAEDYIDFPTDLIPQKGILRDLIDLWKQTTDASLGLLFAAAVSLVIVIAGPKVKLAGGVDGLLLNLWQLMIAPSTVGRKSTVMAFIKYHFRELDMEKLDFPLPTPEGLFHLASDQLRKSDPSRFKNSGIMFLDEFSAFTDSLGKDYMRGFANDLLSAYDNGTFNSYSKSGREIKGRIEGVSILAGTQPKRLDVSETSFESGFLARWNYFFVPLRRGRGAFVRRPSIDVEVAQEVNKKLLSIRDLTLDLQISDRADLTFQEWYLKEEEEVDPEDMLAPFYQRNHDHIWKYAGALSISSGRATIEETDIRTAINIIEWQRSNLRLFIVASRASPREKLSKRLQAKLERSGGTVLRVRLLRDMNLSAQQLDDLIKPFIKHGTLREEVAITKEGVKTTQYRLTNADWVVNK